MLPLQPVLGIPSLHISCNISSYTFRYIQFTQWIVSQCSVVKYYYFAIVRSHRWIRKSKILLAKSGMNGLVFFQKKIEFRLLLDWYITVWLDLHFCSSLLHPGDSQTCHQKSAVLETRIFCSFTLKHTWKLRVTTKCGCDDFSNVEELLSKPLVTCKKKRFA